MNYEPFPTIGPPSFRRPPQGRARRQVLLQAQDRMDRGEGSWKGEIWMDLHV